MRLFSLVSWLKSQTGCWNNISPYGYVVINLQFFCHIFLSAPRTYLKREKNSL
uniref:Uncharacterized protein n=1 Tax=Anguilla anguilla TaxID=7936 RepID=A0A0E9RCK3_ANGAN